MENNQLMNRWFFIAALAVLECPLETKEKISILRRAILADRLRLSPLPLTDLAPFDIAVANCWLQLVVDYHEEDYQ